MEHNSDLPITISPIQPMSFCLNLQWIKLSEHKPKEGKLCALLCNENRRDKDRLECDFFDPDVFENEDLKDWLWFPLPEIPKDIT